MKPRSPPGQMEDLAHSKKCRLPVMRLSRHFRDLSYTFYAPCLFSKQVMVFHKKQVMVFHKEILFILTEDLIVIIIVPAVCRRGRYRLRAGCFCRLRPLHCPLQIPVGSRRLSSPVSRLSWHRDTVRDTGRCGNPEDRPGSRFPGHTVRQVFGGMERVCRKRHRRESTECCPLRPVAVQRHGCQRADREGSGASPRACHWSSTTGAQNRIAQSGHHRMKGHGQGNSVRRAGSMM